MSSVGAITGGCRRWFNAVPPGKSSGRLRQKLTPASTSRTPSRTFWRVRRLMRPSSSSSPQSPHVDPGGRCFHRGMRCTVPIGTRTLVTEVRALREHRFRTRGGHRMTNKDFIAAGDGHLLEPTDLFRTRLPKHLRDRAVWEEDFEIEPLVEGGAPIFRRLHTSGFEGWTISRYRQTSGRMPEGDPDRILEDLDLDGVDAGVMHPNLSLFGLYSDDHELSMAHARVYNDYIIERFTPYFSRLAPTAPVHFSLIEFNAHWLASLVGAMEKAWMTGIGQDADWWLGYWDDSRAPDDQPKMARMFRMNERWPYPLRPSEYVRRQFHVSFSDDPVAVACRHITGVSTIVWGSDYPHAEGTFRGSQELIATQFADVPSAERAAILGGTMGRLLGFEAPVASSRT